MRNSLVLSIILGLLAVAQADSLDSHVRLQERKIQGVLPRNQNQNQNEDGNKNGKASKQKIDDQELAAASCTAAIDTGEPCDHATTVIVTETAAGAAAAVVTGLDSGNGRNKTGKDTKNNNKNQDQNGNGNGKTGNKNADAGAGSDGEHNKGAQNYQGKDRGNVVQILTLDISGNNGNNHANDQVNDKTVTVTKTEVIGNGKANGDQSQAVQLSFVTETVFGGGNAPTVTITPIAQIITQHVTITEKGGAKDAVTVTMQAPAVTVTQQAQAAAVVPPSTVTVTEPGVCTTTDGLAAASPATVVSNEQPSAAVVGAEAAPSPISTGVGNGMGTLDAAGVCGSCHCLCNAQDFPSASIQSVQIASPVVGAAADASPLTTLQTVVTFAEQASSTAAVAQDGAGAASQPGAVAASASVAAVDSTATAVNAAQSDSAPSQVAQGAASILLDTTTIAISSQTTDAAVEDTATQNSAAATAAQPSISESAAGVFAESAQSPTATTDAGAQPTTTTSPDAAVTIAPPSPGALAVENGGGGPPGPIDINTYTLASAIALGHLRRR